MRRLAYPLLALVLIAGAVVATRTLTTATTPVSPSTASDLIGDERVERKRVDAPARPEAHAAEDEDTDPRDGPYSTELLVSLDTRDASLALTRRYVSGIVVDADGAPIGGVGAARPLYRAQPVDIAS